MPPVTGKRKQSGKISSSDKKKNMSSGSSSDGGISSNDTDGNVHDVNNENIASEVCLESPPVSEILSNFLTISYDHLDDDYKKQATNVCKIILKHLLLEELPEPTEQDVKYREVYNQYMKLENNTMYNKMDLFGKSLLEKQYNTISEIITNEYEFKKFNSQNLLLLLKKELDDPSSIIFRTDFLDLFSGVPKDDHSTRSKKSVNTSKSDPKHEKTSKLVMVTIADETIGPETSKQSVQKDSDSSDFLTFEIVTNDGSIDSLEKLLAAKNIFGKQLPKMPKDYIARLVFDRSHRAIIGLKEGRIVGSISFRPFFTQGFAEIAFCAVTGNEQVKGIGSRLMNHLKDYCQTVGVFRFLTYADNYAIGYFKKQGFTKEISLEEKKFKGYIKDYDGGTLMECVIRPDIDYLDIPRMLKRQSQAINQRFTNITHCNTVYPGLTIFKAGGKITRATDIPGINETTYIHETKSGLTETMREILNKVKNHTCSWPFLEPVDGNEVPDYYEVIKNPMDLSTIESRINSGYYRTRDIYVSDFRLIFDNCRTYNSEATEYYGCANKLEEYFKTLSKNAFEKNK